jgi:hypothetical protein
VLFLTPAEYQIRIGLPSTGAWGLPATRTSSGGGVLRSGAAPLGVRLVISVNQEQVRQAIEARHDQWRPLFIPVRERFDLQVGTEEMEDGEPIYAPSMRGEHNHVWLRNIGSGLALNIHGVIFGPRPSDSQAPQRIHDFTYGIPILNGKKGEELGSWGRVNLPSDTTIVIDKDEKEKRVSLCASALPSSFEGLDPNEPVVVGRLTITYHDISKRKHASIFDFVMRTSPANTEWRGLDGGFFSDIPNDLQEIEAEARQVQA